MSSTTRHVINKYSASPDEIDRLVEETLAGDTAFEDAQYEDSIKNFQQESILKGKVISIINDDVIVDIGYKSEGVVDVHEFGDTPPAIGEECEVFLEEIEDQMDSSRRRHRGRRTWLRVRAAADEGENRARAA